MLVLGGLTAIEKNLPWGRRLTRPLGVAADPGGGLRGRRVTERVVSLDAWWMSRPPSRADPRRAPRPGDRGHAGAILAAARDCLLADGYANLSTRRVAEAADVPLSQIHYHFGSKQQLILAVLEAENDAAARTPARDVRRRRSRSGAVGAGLRLPRRATSSRATSGSSRR